MSGGEGRPGGGGEGGEGGGGRGRGRVNRRKQGGILGVEVGKVECEHAKIWVRMGGGGEGGRGLGCTGTEKSNDQVTCVGGDESGGQD